MLLVGVGGSVPHVYEFEKHSRLGDIVVSSPTTRAPSTGSNGSSSNGDHTETSDGAPLYVHCHQLEVGPEDEATGAPSVKFILRRYPARQTTLLDCVGRILGRFERNPVADCEWGRILVETMEALTANEDVEFVRPALETDKLKIKVCVGCVTRSIN